MLKRTLNKTLLADIQLFEKLRDSFYVVVRPEGGRALSGIRVFVGGSCRMRKMVCHS
jgi:hypothetical protein